MDKRLMLIGPGDLGKARARCFKEIEGVQLVAVVSRTAARAQAAAEELSIPLWGTDLDHAADTKSPDAVVIAATNDAHYDLIKWALGRGLDVFVEGPMCTTSAQAEELMDLAIQSRRIIEVGFQRRYHPTIQRAREALQGGEWGPLVYGECEFLYDMRPPVGGPDPWYLSQQATGGMAVAHRAYGLNTLRYVLGDPAEVFAAGNNLLYRAPGQIKHDTVLATLMYNSGAVAHIIANFSAPKGFPTGMFKAHGTTGGFALQILDAPFGTFWNSDQQEDVPQLEGFDDLAAQCEAFARALRGPQELLNHPLDSWRELRIIEGVIKSVELRAPVAVP
jgi:UDP-N-acetyl-2-amino-2-deoxyglucuronate dehydrogenase